MDGRSATAGPPGGHRLRTALAAAAVLLAVAALLLLVFMSEFTWIHGPDDTTPDFAPLTDRAPVPAEHP
ncbi:hypothetical protein ACQI4F_11650 [Mycolicibacterium vaccae]|uniref:hypothetical protein n=1 Tax=Mycolicibacterium vaccae TaxID=1810 RepID=UPI003CEFD652